MSCEMFRLQVVSDDPQEILRAEEHAARCPGCARILAGQERLRAASDRWRQQEPVPPAHLEASIRQTIAGRREVVVVPPDIREHPGSRPRRTLLWWALAASFLLGIGLGVLQIPTGQAAPASTRRLLAASDLEIATAEEKTQVESIAELERQVAPILARVSDTSLASHRAGRLQEYRNRIASLDVTIADVRTFVERNPGHPRARTLLLDAYREKKEILREVLALGERAS